MTKRICRNCQFWGGAGGDIGGPEVSGWTTRSGDVVNPHPFERAKVKEGYCWFNPPPLEPYGGNWHPRTRPDHMCGRFQLLEDPQERQEAT